MFQQEQMEQLMHFYYDDWLTPKKGTYPFPCQTIETLTYDYSESIGIDKRNQSRFMVLVHFPNLKYREIIHVQEYDIESLVGNIGGYIGLFLGYSLINFPKFIILWFNIIKTKLFPTSSEVPERNGTICKHLATECIAEIDHDPHHNIEWNNQQSQLADVRNELLATLRKIDNIESKIKVKK